MDQKYRKLLEKQGYKFIGEHSAVKTCGWTHSELRGKGGCYKGRFYGINAHRCVQMSVAVNFCNLDCVFCWRERNNSSFGSIDDPVRLVDSAIAAQRKLLSGYGGNAYTPRAKWEQSNEPLHFAISLNGENTAYPRLSEFIAELTRRGHSSFLVTNGMLPKVLESLSPPTQLYVSLSAPNEELFKEIDKSVFPDGFSRLLQSMDVLRGLKSKTRTTIRLTVIKGKTMDSKSAREFSDIIKRAMPHFLEVKSYMHLGASRERLSRENMPTHDEVREFCKELALYSGFKLIDESPVSRVCLMMQEDLPWRKMDFGDAPSAELLKGFVPSDEGCNGCDSGNLMIEPLHDKLIRESNKLKVLE